MLRRAALKEKEAEDDDDDDDDDEVKGNKDIKQG